MATEVFETEELILQDGTEVTVKPLNIKRLRKFMEVVNGLDNLEDEDAAIDIMVDATAIALEASVPDLANDRDRLEDALDLPTIWRILKVAGGVELDPNQLAAAAATVVRGTT